MARGKGARAAIRANVRRSTIRRVGSPRKVSVSSQNAGLRLMTGASAGFDQTSHGSLNTRTG